MNFEKLKSEFTGKKISVSEKEVHPGGRSYIMYSVDQNDIVYLGLLNAASKLGMNLCLLLPNDMVPMDLDMSRIVAHVTKVGGEYVVNMIRHG